MQQFTLGLALYDFLPTLFTAVALIYITRLIQAQAPGFGRLAQAGIVLVVTGGFLKALWKLTLVISGQDINWMAQALFPLMAPGFAFIATGFWATLRRRRNRSVPRGLWLLPVAAIVVTYVIAAGRIAAGVERGWFMPIMTLASLGNLGLTLLLFVEVLRRRRPVLAVLFVVNVAMIFVLQRIAQIEPMTIAVHWIEQTVTTVGAAAFAYASFRLWHLLAPETVDSPSSAAASPVPSTA